MRSERLLRQEIESIITSWAYGAGTLDEAVSEILAEVAQAGLADVEAQPSVDDVVAFIAELVTKSKPGVARDD